MNAPAIRARRGVAAAAVSLRAGAGAVFGVLACVLAGCVSGLHSNVPAQQTYMIEPRFEGAAASAVTAATADSRATATPATRETLQVLVLSAAPGLGTDGIAVLRAGGRLDYFIGARWAATAPAMLQTAAIDALRAGGHFTLVEPDSGPFPADDVLSLELRHFEARYDADGGTPTIHVTIVATLGQRGARTVGGSAIASTIADSEVKASDNRMQAVVAAFDEATGQALGKVVASAAGRGE